MIDTPYISVAVALPVPKAYTYGLPEHFQNACSPGVRVLVPFGKKRVTGYILSGQKTCNGITVKQILDVLDDHPLFPESAIPFFRWIADYYLHPLGEVIRTALPSGLESRDETCLFVTEKGILALNAKALTPGEAEIVDFVQKRDPAKLKQLFKTSQNPSVHALVRKMEKQDLITLSYVLKKDGVSARMETFILFQQEPEPGFRMSKKREQIIMLVKQKKEMSLTGLKALIPKAPSLIKPLAEAGVITIMQRRVFRDPLGDPVEPDRPPELTPEQARVVKQVRDGFGKGFSAYLLTGITGSGKTEVYMRLVLDVIEKGKKAIVLVPEIALISQTERRFRARFGERVAVIHSSLSRGELLDQWRKISLDKTDIVIGARSAVFAPFDRIGIIVVDEEHDTSYKQETGLRYNARDLAVVRAKLAGCPVLLGSATPSLQSYQNVILKRFEELKLESRINRNPLPEITLVDLKKYKDGRPDHRIITPELSKAVRQCLDKGDQALIFLNRRGFATFPVCGECGKALTCRFCDITMTLHKGHHEYRCHLCGYGLPVDAKCPECKSKIKPLGFGTEKLESMLKERFPDARIARMDQDSTSKKGAVIKILKSIRNRTVDIVVGTQMLAKGHDFPSITLVGVICADLSLSLPDFRAGERTFQLLAQVAGRAGRGDTPGRVIMQTYNPDHFIIEASRKQDFQEFFHNEAPFRKALSYPPFSRMTQLKISGQDSGKVQTYAETVAGILKNLIETQRKATDTAVQVLGPVEAPIQKISARFRWQILVKSPSAALVNRLVKAVLDHPDAKPKSGISLSVDVDPYSLM